MINPRRTFVFFRQKGRNNLKKYALTVNKYPFNADGVLRFRNSRRPKARMACHSADRFACRSSGESKAKILKKKDANEADFWGMAMAKPYAMRTPRYVLVRAEIALPARIRSAISLSVL